MSWRPSQDLTVYGSYKHGFISGGFNSGSANFLLPLDYDQETVKGFEAGVKASLFDGRLQANFDVFTYKVKGLQVQVTTQGTVQELKNVGSLRTKGAEFELTARATERLTIGGSIGLLDSEIMEDQACAVSRSGLRGGRWVGADMVRRVDVL